MTNMILDRINSYSERIEVEQSIVSQVQQYIVHTGAASSAMQVETTAEPDGQSASNDSELEFSDAISDFPSTSTPMANQETQDQQNWQSVVPNDWVCY